ncbi:MAG: sialate O-acetylesterase [Clostridia bacterium]|nr:sialate O-acetylesterase [Clostridia bacterium]
MKKLLSAVLALAMTVGLVNGMVITASAADSVTYKSHEVLIGAPNQLGDKNVSIALKPNTTSPTYTQYYIKPNQKISGAYSIGNVTAGETVSASITYKEDGNTAVFDYSLYVLPDDKYNSLYGTTSYWSNFRETYSDYLISGQEKLLTDNTKTQRTSTITVTPSKGGHLVACIYGDGTTSLINSKLYLYNFTVTGSTAPTETEVPTASPTVKPTEAPTASPTAKPIVTQPPVEGSVWAEKWIYDFNEFTTADSYSNSNMGTLPGTQAPSITYYNGTITSASGMYGRASSDYHLALKSSTSGESARIFHNIDNVDAPVDNMIAELDVAFTTTTETRYINSYRTTASMNGMVFSADGRIGYYDSANKIQYFKDEEGNDLTYSAKEWYHIANKFDFKNLTITYYLDGNNLGTVIPPNAVAMSKLTEICYKGTSNRTNPGTTYFDNFRISQEQASYVTSKVTSPESRTYLAGTPIKFEGYSKNASGDVAQVVFEIDDEQVYVTENSTYSFTKSDIAPGHHKLVVTAISSDGMTGTSEEINFTVSNYAMPTVYADGMVLQRNKPIMIGGAGIDGRTVTACVNGSSASATVSGGRFTITLPGQAAAKSTKLVLESEGVKTEYNVAIGEVVLCNGQSNMAYYLSQFSSLQPLSDKDYEDIHLYKQTITKSSQPQTDIPTGRWTAATQTEAVYFSAFGFGTGVKLYKALGENVPVGLVFAAEGGTGIQQWVANGVLATDPDTAVIATNSTDYNCMVAPLTKSYTIGHVVWYQGEANTNQNQSYEKALTKYIDSLRADWNDEDITFTIIQLPIFDYAVSYKNNVRTATEVRAAEWNVSERLNKVATVVTIDSGEKANIHPNDKLPLVERASNAIMHFINPTDSSIIYKSPSYASNTVEGDSMTITFKDIAGGLKTKDGEAPRGFKVAGDDNNFVDAAATLAGNTVVIDISGISGTAKVRYAWEDCPALGSDNKTTTLNLVGGTGLPVAPFRTDNDRYMFKVNSDGSYGEAVNFTPMVRNITAGNIRQGKAAIVVNARDYDDEITAVEVFVDGSSIGKAIKTADDEYTIEWVDATAGHHEVHAIATDTLGTNSTQQHETLGTRKVNPIKYIIVFGEVAENKLVYKDGVLSGTAAGLAGTVYLAQYNEAGIPVSVTLVELSETVNTEIEKLTDNIKIFVWDQTQKPVDIQTVVE